MNSLNMLRQVPLLDLSREIREMKPQLLQAIEGVLDSGVFIMGTQVKEFEREAAEYLGVRHAIGLNSGTDALVIGLMAAGIGPGDEVVTTPFTFFATAEAISQVGARPVFVDVDERTGNLDVERLEAAVTASTKAIVPVHLFGQPVNMDRVAAVAKKYGLLVLEDTAQAFGAEFRGRKAGTIGDIGCFSFFPSKNLGAYGDGGLLATNDDEYAAKAAMLRAHGSKVKYHNEAVGFNSRLDELQAAILRLKLPRLEEWNESRRGAADVYRELLDGVPGIALPEAEEGTKHSFHQYTIRVLGGKRNEVQAALKRRGISTMVYYPIPVHRLPVYEALDVRLPTAERLAGEVLSLPLWPGMDREVQEHVASQLIESL
ncbi:DegT/DnrJ/EryC1/StrS family aminotransferase [Cohnella zeiphila]|uniref:DegT/DnrJ/EryC1/StrS family aminotransferase n=1 Tax=Cohnella zeiphila TaxID=2761120 RepID=A0A7X0SQI4_9BACL|nr:DegT/DnrJ/EryC1/StrS family aminotransferase [Cohnella zeiphila]MBB6733065.1 DegT/DnrJ/EryC1/StrS family aminotransferase [Cohnella zeiphila]